MKLIRYVIFIPIILLIVALIYTLLPLSLAILTNLSRFWLIIFLIFFGGLATLIFSLLPGGITWLSAKISPSKKFAFYYTSITSVIFGIYSIYSYLVTPELTDNGYGVFLSIILICLTIGFATSLSLGAGLEMIEYNPTFQTILTIGTVFFYVGIFLVFCLLSTRISYINPDKTYYWYSGIWHGIFVVPHWIFSWFDEDIYCKAPNSTTAYSIWWWVVSIFTVLSTLGSRAR